MSTREIVGRAYAAAFARPGRVAQAVNHALFHLALRGYGYNNGWELDRSGEQAFIDQHVAGVQAPLVVDVGANRGDYTRAVLAANPTAEVIAIEPLDGCYPALAALADDHPGRVTVLRCAAGARRGQATIRYGAGDSEWASLADRLPDYAATAATHSQTVPVETLDDLLDVDHSEPAVHLLKIDVEGWEHGVLAGATRLIRQNPPAWVQLEMNLHQLLAGHTLRGLADLLPGYLAYQLLPHGLRPVNLDRPDANAYGYGNFVFRHTR
jgi:FkbM family methyltransferase